MPIAPHIGVILSGCGVFDGSEIHEAVVTLLCLDQQGATYQCMAPNRAFTPINHLTHKPAEHESRNTLVESARIARGHIVDLATVPPAQFDAFILPGGFGAAKNLSTFAADGADCRVDAQVIRVLTEAHKLGKPIGFLCIAPAIAAKLFGATLHPKITIGKDVETAATLEQMGARHVSCAAGDFVFDERQRILSTPAYMEAGSVKEVYQGINKLVGKLLELARPTPTVVVPPAGGAGVTPPPSAKKA